MAFEYRYRFSVDEEIIRRYRRLPVEEGIVRFAIEIRTNFIVKARSDSSDYERIIDSEMYAVATCREELVRHDMVARLKHYWMPDPEIQQLINEALHFAKRIAAGGRRGMIPTAVDLNVYTLQQEGEAIDATVDRAMRPEYLPPLYSCPVKDRANPNPPELRYFSQHEVVAVRVYDVERAMGVMENCVVCGRKPMVGTAISSLRCGHAFHYHCIVRRLEDDKCCPICRRAAYDHAKTEAKYGQQFVLDDDDDVVPGEVWNARDNFL